MMGDTEEAHPELFKGLFFGMLLGLGLAWFFSTPEGEELKKQMRSHGEDLLDRAKEAIDEALKDDFAEEKTVD